MRMNPLPWQNVENNGTRRSAVNAPAAALTVPPLLTGFRAAPRADTRAAAAPTDEALFEAAGRGDREALGALIERHEKPLFALLVRLAGGDTHRAEDIFQDTFLHAMRAAETFKPRMSFKPWLTAIAVNLVRDDARRRRVRSEVALDGSVEDEGQFRLAEPVSGGEGPGQRAERHDQEDQVRRALGRLTELEREVVLLHFFDGMTLTDSATALEVPVGTVKSRLHAALKRLSRALEGC
jgi:RNA polymerase sigma-70 factor (ECF subfamily)